MAKLEVEVYPGSGVSAYSLYVDGVPAKMGRRHKGEITCSGECGDGSTHGLLYSFAGAPGASLAITLRCAARKVFGLEVEIAGGTGARLRAGRQVFAL